MISGDLFKFVYTSSEEWHLLVTTETESCTVSKRFLCMLLESFLVSLHESVEGKLSWLLVQTSGFVLLFFQIWTSFMAMATDEIALFLFNQLSSVHLPVQNCLFKFDLIVQGLFGAWASVEARLIAARIRSVQEGNVYSHVCQPVCSGDGSPSDHFLHDIGQWQITWLPLIHPLQVAKGPV